MNAEIIANLKADILTSVADLIDEKLGAAELLPAPRLVETEPSSICVFEWSKFAGDPEGLYCGAKVGYASANMSLKCIGPHESMVCYDAMTEELRVYGDIVPERISIGDGSQRGNVYRMIRHAAHHAADMPRARFRELLVGVRNHHNSHWQAVIDGFDHLPPRLGERAA